MVAHRASSGTMSDFISTPDELTDMLQEHRSNATVESKPVSIYRIDAVIVDSVHISIAKKQKVIVLSIAVIRGGSRDVEKGVKRIFCTKLKYFQKCFQPKCTEPPLTCINIQNNYCATNKSGKSGKNVQKKACMEQLLNQVLL